MHSIPCGEVQNRKLERSEYYVTRPQGFAHDPKRAAAAKMFGTG